ncbi:hypothetical protein GBAR_LOCUS20499 [Geodia barretti]|uniref:Uncharacterized protein n=1 Tax=Geodia barretti TaxID=519541 RepID=A0AA35SWA4_GEOBA|nr:hypothetical protein GBAR_LOCUS20499 [Geodia barretti]
METIEEREQNDWKIEGKLEERHFLQREGVGGC